jgi:FKBP-type peptidyl-prolyl cis-trans isomerase SlyD
VEVPIGRRRGVFFDASGLASMITVTQNKLVYITYSILDARGMVVEQYDIPVGYVQGANSGILPAIESAVAGRKVGDRIEITLSPEEGYGLRDESLVFTDDIENVPPQFRRVGAEVMFENDAGETKVFYVTAIEDGKLTLDGNPSLAGQSVTCLVNVMDIREATPEEIRNGRPLDVKTGTVH